MHDDRITGVTFEGNASHNALIVNEEYAWVGNPFSAPEEGRSRKVLPSFRMPVHEGTRHKRPQNAPSRGRGCLQGFANRSRAARVRVPFSAPRQKGESLGILLFCFCMPAHGGLGTCDLKTPLPWAGGDVSKKWRGALVLRLRILLSGRADGQSIESSSSALPPPHFVFPFLPFSLPRISVPSSRCARRRAGVGPCFDSAENSFCLGVLRSLCGPGSRDYSSSENS